MQNPPYKPLFKDKPIRKPNIISCFFTRMFYSLHDAAENGNVELLMKLISSGANVNAKDSSGNTPLIYAALRQHLTCMELLLEAGANPNVRTASYLGYVTPLKIAMGYNDICAVQLLLDNGADYNSIKCNAFRTAMEEARNTGKKQILQMMLAKQEVSIEKPENMVSSSSLAHRLK